MIEMVRRIRRGETRTGLVLANGGYVSYHHVVLLASKPNGMVYPTATYLPKEQNLPAAPQLVEFVQGVQECVVETYTLEYDRNDTPKRGMFILRLNTGARERVLANEKDKSVIDAVMAAIKEGREVIGLRGYVEAKGKRNVFAFGEKARM